MRADPKLHVAPLTLDQVEETLQQPPPGEGLERRVPCILGVPT
jgi:hypothetical protein